ncbi:MAG: patatin-like phospholipase family protein [Actinomycetota bacterium]|nr:patatin-like phospholipase family protein [Actinomycetota bacterium]
MIKRGVVLGGGGLVGMGYLAGALQGLNDRGLDLASADLLVGTSAGSVIASYLAAGWAQSDFYEYAHGRHSKARSTLKDQKDEIRELFVPLWRSNADRARRTAGSFFAVAASRGYWRGGAKGRSPVGALRHTFPSGMYSTERTRERLWEDLPSAWPRPGLFICAADLYSGARVVFGRDDAPEAPLPDAVLASTAIPGMFPPVRIGAKQYVDGGVVSATSLDLAVEEGCEAILCVAPLGYRGEGEATLRDPGLWPAMLVRQFFARSLAREVKEARAKGVEVLVVRPWLSELKAQGSNSMRHYDRVAVSDAARHGTTRFLDDNADHPVARAFAKPKKRTRATG